MARRTLIERVMDRGKRADGRPARRKLPDWAALASYLPGMTRYHPWLDTGRTDMRWLPVNERLELPASVAAPLSLLNTLIAEGSHRVIMEGCGCRTATSCSRYDRDIGCLLIGDSAPEAPASISREVGVDEALAHADKAVQAGLIPMVGKARVDNYIFGIKDRSRLLTVCFCCECCCISRLERFIPARQLPEMFPRLDGMRVSVGDGCDGCGDCVERCYIGAIRVRDGVAAIDERCRGCGRCATICPRRCIDIGIDEGRFLELALERIRAHVRFD